MQTIENLSQSIPALSTERETVRCQQCALVQYMPSAGKCRRCHRSVDAPPAQAALFEPEIQLAIAEEMPPSDVMAYQVFTTSGKRRVKQIPAPKITNVWSDRSGMRWAIGMRVNRIRVERNMSMNELAAAMQVPRTYFSKIENGLLLPKVHNLIRIARTLECRVSDLIPHPTEWEAQRLQAVMEDPFLSELRAALPQLGRDERRLVLNAVKTMNSGQQVFMEYMTV